MENNEVFALFTCDEHKTRDSHRFIGIATTLEKVQEAVIKLLDSNTIGDERDDIISDDIWDMNLDEMRNNISYFNAVLVPLDAIETNGGYYI